MKLSTYLLFRSEFLKNIKKVWCLQLTIMKSRCFLSCILSLDEYYIFHQKSEQEYCNILLDVFSKKRRNLNNYHECQNRVTSACKLHNLIFLCVNVQIWIALYIVWLASSGNQQFQLDGQAGKKSGWDYKVSSHSGMKFRLFIVSKKKW